MEGRPREPLLGLTTNDLAWFAGHWDGTVAGDEVEEFWMPPRGGQLTGVFKWFRSGSPYIYEFMLLGEFEGRVQLRFRHLNKDMSCWEEMDRWTEFTLVSLRGHRAQFLQTNKDTGSYLVYERRGESLRVWFEQEEGEPPVRDVFTYRLRA
ncbi:MAG: hypothetical protein JSS66_03110 [Armatimonadetes bacterium]|nr:hypothetical protein [Armatimonadota bacterium]